LLPSARDWLFILLAKSNAALVAGFILYFK
jgi:hypothetical protein